MSVEPINLAQLSADAMRDFFHSFDTILSDNDGVLSYLGELMPGAKAFVEKMRTHRKQFKIVTNNTTFGRDYLTASFKRQGLEYEECDILTPALAMVHYLKSINFEGKLWLLGSDALAQELDQAGIELAHPHYNRDLPLSDVVKAYLQDEEEIKGIILEFSLNTNYFSIAKIIRLLNRNADLLLIYGADDFKVPVATDQFIIGPGYIQDIVNKETGRSAVMLSKPHKAFGDIIVEHLQCTPTRTLFIGDSLKTDISFAKKLGFQQLLVLTGLTTMQEMLQCDERSMPEYFVSSIEEFNALLNKCNL